MAAVPTPPDFVSAVSSTTQLNQVRDAIKFLQNRPRFKLYQTSAQNFLNGVGAAVTFNAEVLDTDIDLTSGHDNVTNNSRWTCRYPGWYLISGTVSYNANAAGIRFAYIRVNGVDQDGTIGSIGGSAAEIGCVHCHTGKVYLAAGDYVELWSSQNSGATIATYVASAPFQSSLDGIWESS